jgi:hypothetical protein
VGPAARSERSRTAASDPLIASTLIPASLDRVPYVP